MIPKKTPLGRVVWFLGSLNFALLLLATIAIAIATATVLESRLDAKVAQAYIYKAPWFVVWLGFLCVNLCCVTLTRLPWKKKHLGFVITHYGIITLLIGAVVGSHFGYEGNVTLHAGEPPTNRITTARSVLQLEGPADRELYTLPFDAAVVRPSEQRPRWFAVPGTNWKVVVDGYTPNLIRDPRLVPAENGRPSVILKMNSRMAGQRLTIPLQLGNPEMADADLFGLAAIRFREQLPEHVIQRERETQVVFANFAPVVQGSGPGSGVPIHLSKDGREITVGSETFSREEIQDREITAGTARVQVLNYWPDFVIENGHPSTKSAEPNNPAVVVRVDYEKAPPTRGLALELAPAAEGLGYQFIRDGRIVSRGEVQAGGSISPGWMDWQMQIAELSPSAEIHHDIRLPAGDEPETGIPGLRVRLDLGNGQLGEPKWIESGRLSELTHDAARVRIGYGLEVIPVNFTVQLLNFEVPRYEGTETPADYIATLEFRDTATGRTQAATAKMNHPASWPGGFWAVTTGFNYKFSQAEWNPRDLDETTLQVLYDPGWMLKWIGSLAICAGIALMFYWKPKNEKC